MRKILLALTILSFIPFQVNAQKTCRVFFNMASPSPLTPTSITYANTEGLVHKTLLYQDLKNENIPTLIEAGSYILTAIFHDSNNNPYTCNTIQQIDKNGFLGVETTFQKGQFTCAWDSDWSNSTTCSETFK